jgi:uncharacterized protein YoxC
MFQVFKSEKQLKNVTERVETLERQMQGLKMEWTDVLDRMVTMKRRIVRAERLAAERGDTADTGNLSDEEVGNGVLNLSDRARQANAAILARRNRNPS